MLIMANDLHHPINEFSKLPNQEESGPPSCGGRGQGAPGFVMCQLNFLNFIGWLAYNLVSCIGRPTSNAKVKGSKCQVMNMCRLRN